MPANKTSRTTKTTPKADAARDLRKAVKGFRKATESRHAEIRSRKEKLAKLYEQSRASITAMIEQGNVTPTERFLLENIRQLSRTVEGLALYCLRLDDRNNLTSMLVTEAFAANVDAYERIDAVGKKLGALATKVSKKTAKKPKATASEPGAKDAEHVQKLAALITRLMTA